MSTPSLTTRVLALLYRTPEIHLHWKDELSDWILDTHQAGTPLTADLLITHVHLAHPALFQQLLCHPSVRTDLLALLQSAQPTASAPSRPA